MHWQNTTNQTELRNSNEMTFADTRCNFWVVSSVQNTFCNLGSAHNPFGGLTAFPQKH